MKNGTSERSYFDRFVELENQRAALAEDAKELDAEAKEDGIDVKVMKLAVRRHRESAKKREDRVDLETAAAELLNALGEYVNTPLGDAAKRLMGTGPLIVPAVRAVGPDW